MEVSCRIDGSLREAIKRHERDIAQRLTDVMAGVAEEMRDEIRGQIRSAGLGNLGKVLGHASYPKGGTISLRPTALVYVRSKPTSRWPGVLDAFVEGATVRSRKGGWLAIPTKNTPKGTRGRRLTPAEVAERFGPLTSVDKGRTVLLFADVVAGRSGGMRRATAGRARQGRQVERVLMFVLVKEARLSRRLDINAVVKRWEGRLPSMIQAAVKDLEG